MLGFVCVCEGGGVTSCQCSVHCSHVGHGTHMQVQVVQVLSSPSHLMKGHPVMAIVGRSLLLRDPSKVRVSGRVPNSLMASAGGSVGGDRMLPSLRITRLQIK